MTQPLGQLAPTRLTLVGTNTGVINNDAASVITQSLTTAAGTNVTITINSPQINSSSIVLATIQNGSNNAGTPVLQLVTASGSSQGVGSVAFLIANTHATNAFNGSLEINFVVLN